MELSRVKSRCAEDAGKGDIPSIPEGSQWARIKSCAKPKKGRRGRFYRFAKDISLKSPERWVGLLGSEAHGRGLSVEVDEQDSLWFRVGKG